MRLVGGPGPTEHWVEAQVFRAKAVFRQSWDRESKADAHSAKGRPPRGLCPPTVGPGHRGWGPCGRNDRQGHTGILSVAPAPSWLRTHELLLVTLSSSQGLSGGNEARTCWRPLVCQLSGALHTCLS